MDEQKATNLAMWDESVDIHYGSDFYGVERFKAGETTLEELERPEMGSVDGKILLHLQCHFGMDTLSWARGGDSNRPRLLTRSNRGRPKAEH